MCRQGKDTHVEGNSADEAFQSQPRSRSFMARKPSEQPSDSPSAVKWPSQSGQPKKPNLPRGRSVWSVESVASMNVRAAASHRRPASASAFAGGHAGWSARTSSTEAFMYTELAGVNPERPNRDHVNGHASQSRTPMPVSPQTTHRATSLQDLPLGTFRHRFK